VEAVQLIREKKFGHMVTYQNYQTGGVTIKEAIDQIKHVPPEGQVVKTAQAVGISFGVQTKASLATHPDEFPR
jgi:ATP-dependent phosphofructokinase / diphosphate-dependent phosphofructokinase